MCTYRYQKNNRADDRLLVIRTKSKDEARLVFLRTTYMGIDQDFDLELRIGENGKRNETNIQEKRRNLDRAITSTLWWCGTLGSFHWKETDVMDSYPNRETYIRPPSGAASSLSSCQHFSFWTGNAESPNPNISTECMVDVYTSKYTNILYKGIAFLEPSFKRGGKEEALFNVHALRNQSTPGDIGIQTRRYVMFEAVSCCIQEEEDRDGQRSTDRRADDIYAPLLFNL